MDSEGNGRGLIEVTNIKIPWSDWEVPRIVPVSMASAPAEIRIKHLANVNLVRCLYSNSFGLLRSTNRGTSCSNRVDMREIPYKLYYSKFLSQCMALI
jgi:hypothetical protein